MVFSDLSVIETTGKQNEATVKMGFNVMFINKTD